jgi:replication factor C small subunit
MILDLPWVEKYRPHSLNEIIGQKLIVERLKSFVERGNFPSMIFAGSPGVGKTACAIAMANDLYKEGLNSAFLELNASVMPDTPVLVRRKDNIERTTIGEVASAYFTDSNKKYAYTTNLEVLTIDKKDFKVKFLPVNNISRHIVERIQEIKLDGGSIKTTSEHSVIVLNEKCELESRRASDLHLGDLLITFSASINSDKKEIDVSKFAPNRLTKLGPADNSHIFRNPKVGTVLDTIRINDGLAWFFGSYLAEGAIGFRGNTSGVVILTYAYPEEYEYVARSSYAAEMLGFNSHPHIIRSGSSGNDSAIQLTVSSTQLARFLKHEFYEAESSEKNAHSKRVPSFVFSMPQELRHKFLQGYAGDATGIWGDYLRYTSVSKELLIDTAWLARISGLESSTFDRETRIVWKKSSSFYVRSELLPAEPFITFMKSINEKAGFNWRYYLRHQLYCKKSGRVSKGILKDILIRVRLNSLSEDERNRLSRLMTLVDSDIAVTEIKSIKLKEHRGYVYDFAVPDSEMFWGGTIPILLHNSDARGIDVIRETVKEFAKTISMAKVPVKIIFLDEADALTSDAQHALRRTMENFPSTRFILSANYASKIIEPIQSRCVVFRFRPLSEEDMRTYVKRIEIAEKLELSEKAREALIYVGDGDLRRLTNVLQSAAMQHKKITDSSIYDTAAKARPKEIVSMLNYAITEDFLNARNELDGLMLRNGMSAEDILTQCYKEVQNLNIDERLKLEIIKDIGEYNFRIVEGANERIQLEAMLAGLALAAKRNK